MKLNCSKRNCYEDHYPKNWWKILGETEKILSQKKTSRNEYVADALQAYNKKTKKKRYPKAVKRGIKISKEWIFICSKGIWTSMNSVQEFDIWVADLNPRMGTEPGKRRPVVILQTDLLNESNHPSTIICPLTTIWLWHPKPLIFSKADNNI